MASNNSVLIKNGLVIDPANGINQQPLDILIVNGIITQVSSSITTSCEVVYDAAGCLVCPGLIDLHVHCYPNETPLGIDPDTHCLSRGVTTVVDAGSAGSNAIEEFIKYDDTKKTRIFHFIHASRVGLETAGCVTDNLPGELSNIDDVNVSECIKAINKNSERIIGIKIRLSADLANDGSNEPEACRRSLEISSQVGLPLMVHYSFSTIPHVGENNGLGIPSSLHKGDILTHLYHGFKSTILDVPAKDPNHLTIHPSITEAKQRGVYLDIGHGMGAFIWRVAEIAGKESIWPDTISTDLHTMSLSGPAYDLPTVMTKLLHVGMPLYDIIRAVTHTPAKVINKEKMIGSFSIGSKGDVTVLKIANCDVMLEDCRMDTRRVTRQFVPIATWIGGTKVEIKELGIEWPNISREHYTRQKEQEDILVKELTCEI